MNPPSTYDCIVIGGGPAGATVAAIVAEGGARTLIVEREKFPRFHVGEVVLPAARTTLARLGVLERLNLGCHFLTSSGVQFVSGCGRDLQPFIFGSSNSESAHSAWHVDRAEFDRLLLENAIARGAECREQTRVLEVLFDGDRATGVRLQTVDEPVQEVRAKTIVDASGQQSLLATALDVRRANNELRKAAIWGYYQAARRVPGEQGSLSTIFCTRTRDAWFWYLPLAGDVTSVGVVGDADYLIKGRGRPANVLEEELVNCPAVTERLASARLVSKFHVARDFAYDTSRAAGDGWLLVGDAWGFLDPLFSSGVLLALKSGEMAADCILNALSMNVLSAATLGAWEPTFTTGVGWMRKLVHAFYTKEFSFGGFLSDHPAEQDSLTRLLAGELFESDAGKLFETLQPWLKRATERPVGVD
jgi:flavin-dependent dehydrogenase